MGMGELEMKMKVHYSSLTDVWRTPKGVYQTLDAEFQFDFDPCPINPSFDGLTIEWGERNFVNPPYSELRKWIVKSYEQAMKGKLVVMLIPARTDTLAWHNFVMKADEIRFIKGRLRFGEAKNNAPFPSAIVVFKPKFDLKVET